MGQAEKILQSLLLIWRIRDGTFSTGLKHYPHSKTDNAREAEGALKKLWGVDG